MILLGKAVQEAAGKMVLGTWLLDESKSGAMPDCYKRTAETGVKGSTLHC